MLRAGASPKGALLSDRTSLYSRLARFVLANRSSVSIAAAVLTVVALVIGVPPKIDSNLLNLLPDGDPVVAAIQEIDRDEGGLNLLSFTFQSDDAEGMDTYVEALEARLASLDDVEFTMHGIDESLALQVGMLQFEPDDIGELNVRLQGALALGPALNPMVTQRLMDMGPLTEKIEKASDVALLQEDDGRARLIVRPTGSSSDPKFASRFMDQVHEIMAEMPPEEAGVKLLWMGGAYRHAVEDVRGIQQDLLYTSVGSALLVLSVIGFAFRSVRAMALVFPPLVLANAVLLAVVQIFFGALNTYTSFGTAILFGLGIDFAIHLVGRYRELRGEGASLEDALADAWARTGPPCATAALTSAAGFLALSAANFKGFAQLGVLLAIGLVVCLVAMLTLLPALISWFDAEPPLLLGTQGGPRETSTSSYRFAPVGLAAAVVITAVVGSLSVPAMQFEYDVSALRRDGMSYAELTEEERKLAKSSYSPVAVTFDSHEGLLEAQDRIDRMIADGEMPHIGGTVSIAKVLPGDQTARNERLRELVTLVEHKNLRYLPPVLAKRLLPLRGLDVRNLSRDDLPPGVIHLLGARNPDVSRMLMLPKGNMWDVREAHKLEDEVLGALPTQRVASEHIGVSRMFHLAFEDAPVIAVLALLLVTVLSFWDLRKPLWTLGAVGTLVAGLVWATAALNAAGVKLTLVNLSGIPILLGIGVDVVIHLLHRLREEGPGGVRRALRTTGVAAGLSTLTTVCSFLSLTLAGNRGVRSLGMLVVLGLIVVFMVSAAMLPLMWSAGWKVSGRAPADKPIRE